VSEELKPCRCGEVPNSFFIYQYFDSLYWTKPLRPDPTPYFEIHCENKKCKEPPQIIKRKYRSNVA